MNDNDRLADALRAIDTELSEYIDPDAVCDHSIGVCWCGYRRVREKMREALAAHEVSDAEVEAALNAYHPTLPFQRLVSWPDGNVKDMRAAIAAARNAGGSE